VSREYIINTIEYMRQANCLIALYNHRKFTAIEKYDYLLQREN